ncbi:MAG: 8-amino-7-oxononanoate synthase [Candidatus Omnitrophica bacterium]|nr:8-amino-7-oxononanoate synthase [Candidatus Omnitrophota bacterium]
MSRTAVTAGCAAEAERELLELKAKGLERDLMPVRPLGRSRMSAAQRTLVNFGSNDYLGLSRHPRLRRAAAQAALRWGGGSGASRLVSGDLELHEALERRLARYKGERSALVYSSGYLANLGAVTALAGPGDVVLIDRLVHASLVDAARLCGAKVWVYPHLDVARLAELLSRAGGYRRRLVLTDTYFSMDGDVAPLDDLVAVCREHDAALHVDEAHATGVFGQSGSGLVEEFGLKGRIDVVMGTLSKALGSVGGYVAGGDWLRRLLVNRSRAFIYTTGPAPAASAAALEALEILSDGAALRKKLGDNVTRVRRALLAAGYDLGASRGPIIPVLVRDGARAVRARERLLRRGLYVPAMRYPTVARGQERLRITVTATHTREDLDRLIRELGAALEPS